MMKRILSILLVALMLFPTALVVNAESEYNDVILNWGEHKIHVYDGDCDSSCNVCGFLREAADHSYDNTCDATCNGCGAVREAGHEYFNDCDPICLICGEETREVSHNIIHVTAVKATCTAMGNLEYWYCDVCGAAWLDAECTLNTNLRAVKTPATDHTYDNACDAACNNCGETREVGDHIWEAGSCSICGIASPSKVTISSQYKAGNYAEEGETIEIALTAKGEGLKYQWYIKNANGTKYSKSSITTNVYTVKMSSKVHGRRVYCIVTDQYGNQVQSKTAILRRQVSITNEPGTAAYAPMGTKVTVSIEAIGDGLTYQWYYKNANGVKYSKSSITTDTYFVAMSEKVKGRRIYCVVKDEYGKTVQSKTFILRESVSLIEEPTTTVTVKKGYSAKIALNASGDELTYTWYVKDAGAATFTKSSITADTYSAVMNATRNGRQVYCVIKDKYGKTVTTAVITMEMK